MRLRQKVIRGIIVLLLKGVAAVVRFLPWNAASRLGGFLGQMVFRTLKKEREKARTHFNLAFGKETDPRNREAVLLKSFENLGRSILEVLKLPQVNKKNIDRLVRFQGEENLKEAFERKKGIVFVTAHFGNWELMGAALSIKGYPTNVIAAPLYDSRIDEIMIGIRTSQGIETITRGGERGSRMILSALKKNQILGLLIDQDIDAEGVFVDFFNRPAYTPSGAASLALRSGASVIFGFIERVKNNRHLVKFEGPAELRRSGNAQKDIHDNTAYFTQVIEKNIRRRPDHWVWMHNRWKTLPSGHHEPS